LGQRKKGGRVSYNHEQERQEFGRTGAEKEYLLEKEKKRKKKEYSQTKRDQLSMHPSCLTGKKKFV